VRSTKRLERAGHRLDMLRSEIAEYYGKFRIGNDLLELRNLALVGELIIRSAMARRESRGLHYTIDYPHADPVAAPQNTILVPDGFRLATFE
jgi:L-aspartate oxidase